jgi:hypothetical protein
LQSFQSPLSGNVRAVDEWQLLAGGGRSPVTPTAALRAHSFANWRPGSCEEEECPLDKSRQPPSGPSRAYRSGRGFPEAVIGKRTQNDLAELGVIFRYCVRQLDP